MYAFIWALKITTICGNVGKRLKSVIFSYFLNSVRNRRRLPTFPRFFEIFRAQMEAYTLSKERISYNQDRKIKSFTVGGIFGKFASIISCLFEQNDVEIISIQRIEFRHQWQFSPLQTGVRSSFTYILYLQLHEFHLFIYT